MFDFTDQVVVITGAGGEIPSAVARIFADGGAHLVLTDVDEAKAHVVAQELQRAASAVAIQHDVADPEHGYRVGELCRSLHGRVDCIVTGAGLYQRLPLSSLTAEQWRRTLAINLDGVMYTIMALSPLLSDGSAIVNIASHAGHQGSPEHTPYAAAKGGVLTLSRSLARELAPRTRVNAVSPGLIDTAMLQAMEERRREALAELTPLKRLGRAHEIAHTVAYLCSSASSFITGATLHANGGLYIAS